MGMRFYMLFQNIKHEMREEGYLQEYDAIKNFGVQFQKIL